MSLMIEQLREWFDSDKGRKHMEEYVKELLFKDNLKDRNIYRLKNMFTSQKSFNLLVNKIIEKHDNAWRGRCYEKGVQPYPWELMYALFNLAEKEGSECGPVDGLTDNFPSSIYSFKGWQFAITQGQGAVMSVYYRKKLMYRD